MASFDYKRYRRSLLMRSARYSEQVKGLYDVALSDIARLFSFVEYNPDNVFSFSEVGLFGDVDGIMNRLEDEIQRVINNAIVSEFGAVSSENNELLHSVLGENINEQVRRAFAPKFQASNAAKVFIREQEADNITHSTRVWNGSVLGQLETAVQEGLMDGVPARQMAGLMEQYLNDPDSCFRRFRIKTGVDAEGKSMYGRKWKKRVRNADGTTSWFDADPRDYPTGQGVYHSSYKNALRYTRTTTNIAYRTADYERYQTEDFVLGIEIRTTSNHAHKEDICDFLAGRYPKDFKWVGWHPLCLCHEIPILATADDVNAMADAILNGDDPSSVHVAGRITDVPDNFKEWVGKNKDRIQETIDKGKQLPYFLKDNMNYVIKEEPKLMKSVSVGNTPSVTLEQVHAMQHSLFDYAQTLAHEDERIYDMLDALTGTLDPNEQYKLTIELKKRCAELTKNYLSRYHKTDGLTYVGNLFDETISTPIDEVVYGQRIVVEEVKADLILYKDSMGKEYTYVLGIDPSDVLDSNAMLGFNASLPNAMNSAFDRFTFVNFHNPQDAYWKVCYKDPSLVSFATDGRNVTFYKPVDESSFARALPHELGHSISKSLGLEKVWKAAMDADQKEWDRILSQHRVMAPSKYAEASIDEDIAESFLLFVEDRYRLEGAFPNRYKIIASIAGML